ncbi:MAG: RICIN domain-containing protein [Lachnospiraceae bacterium]|nr:RICIN domain-containing protein [Lachnospiraceae bacterium]
MARKRSILLAAFTVFFAMFVLQLSAFCVSARDEMKPGLIVGWPDWENDRPQFSYNLEDYGTELMNRASYSDCLQIGWVDNEGNVTPISLANADDFTLIYTDGGEAEYRLKAHGEWEYDPATNRDKYVATGDGLFDLGIPRTGFYTLIYEGPETQGAMGDFCTVEIRTILPPMGLYSKNSVRDNYLLDTENVLYTKGSEFYLLGYNTVDEYDKTEVSDIRCQVRGDADVDFTPLSNGHKLTIQDAREMAIDIQVFFTVTYSHKDENTNKWTVLDEHQEDRWFFFDPAPRKGLAVGWPEDGIDGPEFSTEYGRLRGWVDRRASYTDWMQAAWISEDGTITPISIDNLDDFSFTTADGKECDYRFDVSGEWTYDDEKEEDVIIPYGDGFFNLGFLLPGEYTMTYSGPEAAGADPDECSVTIEVEMPAVGLYSKNEAAPENLIWIDEAEYTGGSVFYIIPRNKDSDGQRQEVTDLSCENYGERCSVLEKSGSGYKLTVPEDSDDWFNVQAVFTIANSHYDEEYGRWVVHNSHEEDRWFHFRPMEKYGLVIGYVYWEDIPESDESRPYFPEEDMRGRMEVDAYDVPAVSLGWKGADGVVRPIPLTSIDKFKAYDAQGKEMHDWIWPHKHWDRNLEDEVESGDGMFAVQFGTLGKCRIEYEGEAVSADVLNMTNAVTVNVVLPSVALYSAKEATWENLLCPNFETRSILYTDNKRVFYINPVDKVVEKERKTAVTLLPDEIEVDGAFEDGEWQDKVSFKKLSNGSVKVTVLPGYYDWLDLRVPFMRAEYHWDDERNDWVYEDEWYNDTWIMLDYQEVTDISRASISGVSLSYGYSGKAYTPAFKVIVDGVTLTEGTDYTYKFTNNKNPGTAKLTITGKGNYTGTRVKTFEIVDCVSSLVSGKTYQLIPKNNSKTAVCSYSGKMVNNTKVYITDRSNSEAMKFKAVKNSDGNWKFINAKCELVLAVQQNSTAVGKGLVLYNNTTKAAQNWKLSRKSDNSFAIMNAVTGYSIAMSDASAVKGTTLSMAETASSGLQRFYIAETSDVSAPFDGTYAVKAAKDKRFVLNIASSSKEDGANVNLYAYSNTNAKKFQVIYSGGGYYRLVNVNSGLCLTVKGNTKVDNTNVIQSAWAAQSGQRWKITKNSDGTVTLTNALGTVLHLNGNKTSNNTNVLARNAASTTAQRWYLN